MEISLQSEYIEASGPLLLVHGGAWDIPDAQLDELRTGLRTVLEEGESALQQGDEALPVVTEAVTILEDHEAFNAGYGAMLNQKGEAELDAGVMKGETFDFGAVAATRHLAHPVYVARQLLTEGEGRVRFLVAEGAERFAETQGIQLISNDRLICPRERRRYKQIRTQAEPDHQSQSFLPGVSNLAGRDTVGGIARDASGHLAAATSTGGTPFKPPGRVGDSPLPGAGFYADDRVAVSATGWGEAIAAVGLARTVREHVGNGATAEIAARKSLLHMHEQIQTPHGEGATGGCIVVTPNDAACAFTTPRMARGWSAATGTLRWEVERVPRTRSDRS